MGPISGLGLIKCRSTFNVLFWFFCHFFSQYLGAHLWYVSITAPRFLPSFSSGRVAAALSISESNCHRPLLFSALFFPGNKCNENAFLALILLFRVQLLLLASGQWLQDDDELVRYHHHGDDSETREQKRPVPWQRYSLILHTSYTSEGPFSQKSPTTSFFSRAGVTNVGYWKLGADLG